MDLTAFRPYLPNISGKTGCLDIFVPRKLLSKFKLLNLKLKKITKNYIFIFINIRADDSKNFTVYIIFQKNEKLLETVFSKIKKKKSKKKKKEAKRIGERLGKCTSPFPPLTFSPIASLLFRRKKNGATFDNYIAGS